MLLQRCEEDRLQVVDDCMKSAKSARMIHEQNSMQIYREFADRKTGIAQCASRIMFVAFVKHEEILV